VKQPNPSRPQVEYSNLFSRLFLKSFYENQWVIPEPLPGWLDWFLRTYERRCMEVDVGSVEIDRPVFILSLPRSGSSMLQDLMCANPAFAYTTNFMDICRNSSVCAAEVMRKKFGFNIRGERFLKDSVAVDGGSPADPVATWLDVFGEDAFHISEQPVCEGPIDPEAAVRAKQKVREVLWTFGEPRRRFFCKTPMLLPYAGALQAIFPDAKFIHLIRDPRAVANSMVKIHRICDEQLKAICARKKRPLPDGQFVPYPRLPKLAAYLDAYGAEDLQTPAHLWNDAIEYMDSQRESLSNLHEVRFESILEDPAGELAALFDFCEVPQPENDSYCKKLSGVGRVHHKNQYHGYETIESTCRDLMARYDY